jgi:HAMP domain-containing protein
MAEDTNVLASAAAFEEYCASLTERLSSAKSARLEFLNYAVERLQALENLAQTVGSTDVAASVNEQLTLAQREIEALNSAAGGDPW